MKVNLVACPLWNGTNDLALIYLEILPKAVASLRSSPTTSESWRISARYFIVGSVNWGTIATAID